MKAIRILWKSLLTFLLFVFSISPAVAEKGTLKIGMFPAPPKLSATVKFLEPSGNSILDADETGKLIIETVNSGPGDAFDVIAEIKPSKNSKGLFFARQIPLGTIAAGQRATKEVELKAAEDIPTDMLTLDIDIREANGFDPNPLRITFKTKSFEPPELVVADMGIHDRSGNARVEPMEIVEITARIQNIGHGDARNVQVEVLPGENVFMAGDGVTHFELGSIPSGTFKDIKFMFYTNTRIKNGETIPITVGIKEARPQFHASQALQLVMNALQKRTEEIVVRGVEQEKRGEVALAGGLSVDVDMRIPEGRKAGRYDIAVIIGNKQYSGAGVPDIDFADRDARIMKEYLIQTFGYDPENIIYAENATFAKFNEIFGSERDYRGRLFNNVKKGESKVFIYYVGHGAPDLESQDAYFVPVDANPQYLKSNGYRLQTFYENLAKIPAKNITIVLDACFSGNSEKGLLFKGISPAMVKVKKEYSSPMNAVLLTSAGIDQVSTWYPEKKHSLFTYFFLKGLQGEADANRDQKVTVGEMRSYLEENVPYMARRLRGVEQMPVVQGNASDVLVELKK
jgi:hypothetical protein